jgi:UV DNA damage endonuclease
VKVLGEGGLPTVDARRWQNEPHLSRSLDYLEVVADSLDRRDLRMYRLSSNTVPYGTHPDLPRFDFRRQIRSCRARLHRLGARFRAAGVRISTHPGQYVVINGPEPDLVRKSLRDLEQDALLLDELGAGLDAVVVVHVGGVYGDRAAALDRWARAYDRLSARARARVVVENDELCFDLSDVMELHRRTGVRVVFDYHHHRCKPAGGLESLPSALAAAFATWPDPQRPKVHLSSPRTELRLVKRPIRSRRVARAAPRRTVTSRDTATPAAAAPEAPRSRKRVETVLVAPTVDQHADLPSPWDAIELLRALPRAADVMVEAKAKDVAVLWLRTQLERLDPALAAAEERSGPAGESAAAGGAAAPAAGRPRRHAGRAAAVRFPQASPLSEHPAIVADRPRKGGRA